MNERNFYNSKARLFFFFLITVAVGLFFAVMSYVTLVEEEQSIGMLIVFIVLSLILFPVSFMLLRKMLTAEPAVTVSDKGITITGYVPRVGFIPWEKIDGCLLYSLNGQYMAGFVLYNEDEFIKDFSGVAKKLFLANQKMGFPAVNVSINYLKDKQGFLEALGEQEVRFYEIEEEQNVSGE